MVLLIIGLTFLNLIYYDFKKNGIETHVLLKYDGIIFFI